MAERGHERAEKALLLLGSGSRAREAGAVLAALSGVSAGSDARAEPLEVAVVADLEELLAQRSREGVLILEAGRVPAEDIGFVRRFLERHPAWRLVVVGENAEEPRARALAALARAQWLAWPPDLERLRALLPANAGQKVDSERREGERGRRGPARAAPAASGGVDLGELLEEVLAGAALRGSSAARFLLAPGPARSVAAERKTLLAGLHGLVELARVCAGDDGLVRAALGGSGESSVVSLEFPRAGLPEKAAALLELAPERLEPALAAALAGARRGAEVLTAAGAAVGFAGAEPGRVRCEVRFAPRAPALETARRGKPEDPFA